MKLSISNIVGQGGKSFLAIFFIFLAGGAFAVDTRTWTGAAGNNLWSDKNNWDPQVAASTYNVFPAGQDYTIIVSESANYYSFELPEGSGTVTLKGSASLGHGSGAYVQIGAGRELKIDGPSVDFNVNTYGGNGFINGTLRLTSGSLTTKAPAVFGGEAKLIVEGGTFGNTGGALTLTNNATLTVSGGLAQARGWNLRSPDPPRESLTRIRLLGGTLWQCYQYAYTFTVDDGARFDFLGGTLLWGLGTDYLHNRLSADDSTGQGESFYQFFPAVGGNLIIPTSSTADGGTVYFSVSGDYNAGGTIYATNNTATTTGNVNFYGENIALRGGATVFANAVKFSQARTDSFYDLELNRLNLGIGGVRQVRTTHTKYQNVNLLDGIVFGAWGGDVPMETVDSKLKINLFGPVVYDTRDCFEPETSRDINMTHLYMDGVSDLKAVGGGTVSLSMYATWAEEFRTVEVADDTTLAFSTNQVVAGIKTMNLKLGNNAKLKINLAGGAHFVDASSTAEFGEGAKIVVTLLPDELKEGQFYPIYFAPAGTDPDLSKIEYEQGAWPTGWYLAKTGNAVYLTDGKITAYEGEQSGSTKVWSGEGADNVYANVDNWVNNAVAGAATGAQFKGLSNTVVSVQSDLTVRYFDFYADSGPFMFSGNKIHFQYPSSATSGVPTSQNHGKFPVVISNRLEADAAFRFHAHGQGSTSLTGGSTQEIPLIFGGDIRIGGNWTSRYLYVMPKYSASAVRRSRLTVMPGATLTVTHQEECDFNERSVGALAVAKNATATIGGTQFLLTSNNTHYVDGALTVNCPLVPTGRQVFRGDGTLTLAGGVADAPDGGVRVEGNLTLVPSNLVNNVTLSVKDNVTIAPAANWIFGGDATLDLEDHSTLTLATGGHKATLAKPLASEGTLAVTGGGKVVIAASGMSLGRVTCAGGATLTVSDALAADEFVDVLTVREDDESIAFAPEFKVIKRRDAETGRTVYSAKQVQGLILICR